MSNQNRTDRTTDLANECRTITRYLLNKKPSQALIKRYAEANTVLFTDKALESDLSIIEFIGRNPWSLPFLDAASALFWRNSLLRNKIVIMIAILEATPEFADSFLPEPFTIPGFLWRMAGVGISSVAKTVIGVVIYPFALKTR